MQEHDLYAILADYLRYRHNGLIWRFDIAADLKLTIGQAKKHKRLQQSRGYPDLFLAEPRGGFHGLFIELKKEGTRLNKKNGDYASEHIKEQAELLEKLRERGYAAEFACGFDEAKTIIDRYLK